MRINLFLSDTEERNLKSLLERYGGKAPAYLRMLILRAFEKEFGGYKATKPGAPKMLNADDDLTNEQLCEKYGGKVMQVEGNWVCRFPTVGESGRFVPLSARDDFKSYQKK